MKFSTFLPSAEGELQDKLLRLAQLSKVARKGDAHITPFWPPHHFNLGESPFWSKIPEETQTKLLNSWSQSLILESVAIEHAGIAYANKMALLSKLEEERFYYTVVAQEELAHLNWLNPFLNDDYRSHPLPSFALKISEIIEAEDRLDLMLIIQVLLEGWGITHYQSLLTHTQNKDLSQVFRNILRDEMGHHMGGVYLLKHFGYQLSSHCEALIQTVLDFVRVGPFMVADSVIRELKLTSQTERVAFLVSIGARDDTQKKLDTIRSTLLKILEPSSLNNLNFKSLTEEEMEIHLPSLA